MNENLTRKTGTFSAHKNQEQLHNNNNNRFIEKQVKQNYHTKYIIYRY